MIPRHEDGKYQIQWRHSNTIYHNYFSASKIWEQVRSRKSRKDWSRIVWFTQGVPRLAFITWLAMKDRISIGERTRSWGHTQAYLLCGEPDKTRDHLLFACPHYLMVWLEALGELLEAPADPNWNEIINRLITHSFDRDSFILLWLALQTTIYYVWRERNERKHKGCYRSTSHLLGNIDKMIRNRISSLRSIGHPRYENLMQRWFQTNIVC